MKRKIQLKKVAGKTVKSFALSAAKRELLISFKDETFIVVGIREETWEDNFNIVDVEFSVHDFLEQDLINSSIYSAKELADAKEAIQNRNETLAEIAERATYKRLKIKYEKED